MTGSAAAPRRGPPARATRWPQDGCGSALFQRVKLESVVQNKQINEVVGEALELYLRERGSAPDIGTVTTASWGALPVDRELVRSIVEEEDGLFDA